jgi:hypothetical protein
MPRLTVWFVRAALFHLLLGFTLGGLLLFHKGLPFDFSLWLVLPAHIEFLLVGWMAQLIFGVAFWILPRLSSGPPRGNENLAWLAFGLLNAGVWLAGVGASLPAIALAGRSSEAMAALIFGITVWPRVKAFGR